MRHQRQCTSVHAERVRDSWLVTAHSASAGTWDWSRGGLRCLEVTASHTAFHCTSLRFSQGIFLPTSLEPAAPVHVVTPRKPGSPACLRAIRPSSRLCSLEVEDRRLYLSSSGAAKGDRPFVAPLWWPGQWPRALDSPRGLQEVQPQAPTHDHSCLRRTRRLAPAVNKRVAGAHTYDARRWVPCAAAMQPFC